LGHNALEEKGTAALRFALQLMPGLTCLNLLEGRMGPAGMKALAPALQRLTGLLHL
jgi:hypothetical protein